MASQTAPKTRQIVMLYDGAIRFMQQAKEAIVEKRIQDRYNLLVKASEIIISMQNCLDHENGGNIARILHDFYASVDMSILSIHRSNNTAMCDRVIEELKKMRGAWAQIDETLVGASAMVSAPIPSLEELQPIITSDMTLSQVSPPEEPIIVPEGGLQVSA